MVWGADGWPVIGWDPDGNGRGEPVGRWRKPAGAAQPITAPPSSDELDSGVLGLQWQWQANPEAGWWSLTAAPGALRLIAQPLPEGARNLWMVPSLLMQKPPAEAFVATTELRFHPARTGERAGLLVFGTSYAWAGIEQTEAGPAFVMRTCADARGGENEHTEATLPAVDGPVWLRVAWRAGGACRFSVSRDGVTFEDLGPDFVAAPGRWVGARLGVFASRPDSGLIAGDADFAWFRVRPPARPAALP